MKQQNILVINPISIVGDIIIRGIARGFETLGHNVLSMDVRELNEAKIKQFKPDFVFGLGYVHLISDEAEKIIKNLEIPVLHYFIDNPNDKFAHAGDLTLYNKLAKTDGIIFCWDSHYLDDFKTKAYYLPVGIDVELYKNVKNGQKSEIPKIVFTGRPLTDRREEVVAHIVKHFPEQLEIYSYESHFNKSVDEMLEKGFLNKNEIEKYKKCYKGFLKSEEELADVYNNATIILNITMAQGASSMNYRVLEVMASRAFLLTDYIEDTAKYFVEDEELVFYRNLEDLSKKIKLYLHNAELRNEIAGNGQKKVQENHTLIHRAKEILDVMNFKKA